MTVISCILAKPEIELIFDECRPIFMDAIRKGKDCLIAGWEGHFVDPITDLNIGERIGNIALGILLLIPVINIIVFSIFSEWNGRVQYLENLNLGGDVLNCVREITQSCILSLRSTADEVAPIFDECCPVFMDAIRKGKNCLIAGWEGRSVDPIAELSVAERIGNIALGLLLLIPVINVIVFDILAELSASPASYVNANDVFWTNDIHFELPSSEECAHRKERDLALLQNPQYREWTVNGAQYQQTLAQYRRDFATWEAEAQTVRGVGSLPQMPRWLHIPYRTPDLSQFPLNNILSCYSSIYSSSIFNSFRHLLSPSQREKLIDSVLNRYRMQQGGSPNRLAQNSLARLNDFLNQRWREYQGTEHEEAFKGYVVGILLQIIDAHQNCVDQVNSQLEALFVDVVAGWHAGRDGTEGKLRLQNRAQYECLKYCLNVIKEACVMEYPTAVHAADLERHVKTKLASRYGFHNEVTATGAVVPFAGGEARHIENVVFRGIDDAHIPDYGQRITNPALYDARLKQHREDCRYAPVQHLIEELRVPYGDMRNLRNQILMWARQYYGLDADDERTQAFIDAISADPNLPGNEGGALTYGAIILFLEKLGILLPEIDPSRNLENPVWYRLEQALPWL